MQFSIIRAQQITDAVEKLLIDCNYYIGDDIRDAFCAAQKTEASPVGRAVLGQLLENSEIAAQEQVPLCQDTGMAILFVEYGQNVAVDGDFEEAVQQGVRGAYCNGYLRKSVVGDPVFERKNTNDNTPAIIYTTIVPGRNISILAGAKGFGSENMSAIKMLSPAQGLAGVKGFILDTVRRAGPNPCPPIVVGVGVGGTFEKAALLAKKATLRSIDVPCPDARYAALEQELLTDINRMGFGPAGLGGTTTALGVNIEVFPTHIAGLPVAVNICCHAARHGYTVIEGTSM